MRNTLLHTLTFCIILFLYGNGHCAWVQKAPFGGEARHRCTGFSINNKGYIGGGHVNAGTVITYKDYWEYDPGTNTWTQIADFGGGYRYHTTAFTIGDYGYVGLGEDDDDAYFNDFWKYIPLINTWVQVAPYPGLPRRGACSFVIADKGYVGTGQSEMGYTTDFYVYDPIANEWSAIANFIGEARSSAVAFSYNGMGYVGTGHIFGDDTNDFYQYNPMLDTWTQKSSIGTHGRQDATGFVVMNEGYIGTGNDAEGTDNYGDFWKYNFDTDTWQEIAEFDGQSRRYMVSFVIDEVAYCGTGTNGTNFRDFWAFYPYLTIHENNSTISVYPNPVSEKINFTNLPQGQPLFFKITNLNGQTIWLDQNEGVENISLNNLEPGIYFLSLFDENTNLIFNSKITKL